MKMKEILAEETTPMKERDNSTSFIILGPGRNRDSEEEGEKGGEKILCPRCEKKTTGKDFCENCGMKRQPIE